MCPKRDRTMDDYGKQNRQIHKDKYEFCLMCEI